MIKQSWRKVAAGVAVLVAGAGTVVFASGDTGVDQVTCRTKAGYLRISNTGECRRSETVVDLPTAGDYNALVASNSALNDRLTALESTMEDMQSTNQGLSADVSDVKRRLPTAFSMRGFTFYPGADLAGANLSGFDLSGRDLAGVNFASGCAAFWSGPPIVDPWSKGKTPQPRITNLSGANLSGANLSGANFQVDGKAAFPCYDYYQRQQGDWWFYEIWIASGADLSNANLSGAIVTGVNLSGVNLSGADLSGADLSGADLYGDGYPANLSRANLSRANLSRANLVALDLSGLDLSNANLKDANLKDANLKDANLKDANLSAADLTGVSSGGISGSPAALPDGWKLVHGNLVGRTANLAGADLHGADLHGMNLSEADLQSADMSYAELTGATFTNLTLSNANLTGANLTGAHLDGVYLEAVNLTGANLAGATSSGLWGTPAALPDGWSLVNGTLVYTQP